jgi:hypothetical protein
MAKYAEGNSANPVVTDTGISSAAHNAAETQLAGMLGPLKVSPDISSAFFDNSHAGGAPYWTHRNTAGYLRWYCINNTFALYHGLGTLRAGQKITAISATVTGTTTGGSILLLRQSVASPAAPTTVATFPTNPWNTSGAWTAQPGTISGSSHVILADSTYYLKLTAAASSVSDYYGGMSYTIQFGN